MKTKNLLLTLGAVALTAITINAAASDALLSPRGTEMQIKHVSGTNNDPNLVAQTRGYMGTPRSLDLQIKTVAGTSNDFNPSLACVRNMTGSSPKAISTCADHPGAPMPCCAVAMTK
jgi:hypothetical protein